MDIANRRAKKIVGKLSALISEAEELKINHGVSSQWKRQWKKNMKARYSTFLVDKEKLAKFVNNRQEEIDEEMERKGFEAKQEQQREEERRLTESRLRQGTNDVCGRRKLMQNYRRPIIISLSSPKHQAKIDDFHIFVHISAGIHSSVSSFIPFERGIN